MGWGRVGGDEVKVLFQGEKRNGIWCQLTLHYVGFFQVGKCFRERVNFGWCESALGTP